MLAFARQLGRQLPATEEACRAKEFLWGGEHIYLPRQLRIYMVTFARQLSHIM
jgi:hypothetical protein